MGREWQDLWIQCNWKRVRANRLAFRDITVCIKWLREWLRFVEMKHFIFWWYLNLLGFCELTRYVRIMRKMFMKKSFFPIILFFKNKIFFFHWNFSQNCEEIILLIQKKTEQTFFLWLYYASEKKGRNGSFCRFTHSTDICSIHTKQTRSSQKEDN